MMRQLLFPDTMLTGQMILDDTYNKFKSLKSAEEALAELRSHYSELYFIAKALTQKSSDIYENLFDHETSDNNRIIQGLIDNLKANECVAFLSELIKSEIANATLENSEKLIKLKLNLDGALVDTILPKLVDQSELVEKNKPDNAAIKNAVKKLNTAEYALIKTYYSTRVVFARLWDAGQEVIDARKEKTKLDLHVHKCKRLEEEKEMLMATKRLWIKYSNKIRTQEIPHYIYHFVYQDVMKNEDKHNDASFSLSL